MNSHNNVDISQQTSAPTPIDDESPLNHSHIRALRGIPALRYARFLNDPIAAKQFIDGWEDNAENAQADRAKGATEEELALVREARPGEGEADDEYLNGPEGAAKWNRMRKKL